MWEKIGYIHRNPVKRGLVAAPIDWRWSSARWYAGDVDETLPIDIDPRGGRWRAPGHWIDEAVPMQARPAQAAHEAK